jgi:hypothetical protein
LPIASPGEFGESESLVLTLAFACALFLVSDFHFSNYSLTTLSKLTTSLSFSTFQSTSMSLEKITKRSRYTPNAHAGHAKSYDFSLFVVLDKGINLPKDLHGYKL